MEKAEMTMAQAIEYERIIRTHERKAKTALIKQKEREYIAQGIDKEVARTMAKVFYEYVFRKER